MGGDILASFILMQRIHPPVLRATLVRSGHAHDEEATAELGVYGIFVKVGHEVTVNKSAGYLLRTKPATRDEGGVCAGFAVLDSPYLIAADGL